MRGKGKEATALYSVRERRKEEELGIGMVTKTLDPTVPVHSMLILVLGTSIMDR